MPSHPTPTGNAIPELQRLRADHAAALLAFEQENRTYFAASVPDRGEDYFTHFEARHRDLLAEQTAGLHYFHVLIGPCGEVLGQINLVNVQDRSAELGFRIAERAAGQGLATTAVRQTCVLAATEYKLAALQARTTRDNTDSRAVLARTGFVHAGEVQFDSQAGLHVERDLHDLRWRSR